MDRKQKLLTGCAVLFIISVILYAVGMIIINNAEEEIARVNSSSNPSWDKQKRIDPELNNIRMGGILKSHLIW